jgi:lipoprotein NlpD
MAPLILAACAAHPPSPTRQSTPTVTEQPIRPATTAAAPVQDGPVYTVKKGDTLYSIALDQGKDYKELVAWNNLENPNLIKIGQQLRLSPPGSETSTVAVVRPITSSTVDVKPVTAKPLGGTGGTVADSNTETLKREPKGGKVAYSDAALAKAKEAIPVKPVETAAEPRPTEAKVAEKQGAEKPVAEATSAAATDGGIEWSWPANGNVLNPFNEGTNKGVDIAGKTGEPVHAAAPGKVVYAGTGLRGYGKLVIVRHNAEFLSAYAHNNQILVKEGQTVTRRQVIAEIGSSDADSSRLHFEIRRQGKPVDPMKFLPAR